MHYYDFNVSDYRKDTVHLKPIEHYIYRTLIDWYYLDETPIPNKTQVVIRRLSLGIDNEENLLNVLNDFFKLRKNTEKGGDFWHHDRIDHDISRYHENAVKNKVNGSKGGRPKKNKDLRFDDKPKKTQSVILDNPDESETNPNYKLVTNNQELITNNQEQIKEKDLVEQAQPEVAEKPKTEKPKTEIIEIFDFWKSKLNHEKSNLDEKRRKLISNALKSGYTKDQIMTAITGCSKTPHNMGINDRRTVYDGLHIILDSKNIDRFISTGEAKSNGLTVGIANYGAKTKAEIVSSNNRNAFGSFLGDQQNVDSGDYIDSEVMA